MQVLLNVNINQIKGTWKTTVHQNSLVAFLPERFALPDKSEEWSLGINDLRVSTIAYTDMIQYLFAVVTVENMKLMFS